jgi:hypothetical protein
MIKRIASFVVCLAVLMNGGFAHAALPRTGVTFSQVQCEYLNLDWTHVYRKTLDSGCEVIRLGAYWSRIESQPGVYDFSELDRQLEQAEKHGVDVIVTVGMKAPRWPEFFIPSWIEQRLSVPRGGDVAQDPFLRGRVRRFIRDVVIRYRDRNVITCWQVENEPLNRIGPNDWYIGEWFLRQELELVKSLDGHRRKTMLNVATYPHPVLRFLSSLLYPADPVKLTGELADVFAVNIYPTVGHKLGKLPLVIRTGPRARGSYFKRIFSGMFNGGRPVWITELQAEPWDPGKLVHTSARQPVTIKPWQMKSSFQEFASHGAELILLWGVEYWYYRKVAHGDQQWWEAGVTLMHGKG